MKKILFALLISLCLLPGVNATEISCSTSANLLKPNNFIDGLYKPFNYSPTSISYYSISYNSLIPIESNTNYAFKMGSSTSTTPRRVAVVYYDENQQYLSYTNEKTTDSYYLYTFRTLSNARYMTLHLYNVSVSFTNSSIYQLSKGTNISSFVDYEECIIEEPEEPIIADNTLNNFYSIYLDKLKDLSQFATENKFILSAIVIVIFFVCLDLFLFLFKGGRH